MATTKTNALEQLRQPFPVEQVKTRPGGGKTLDYVAIETVLERLLDVAPDYSWSGQVVSFSEGVAVVSGQLTIGDKTAFGVGAMKNATDPDMAVKSANSEAIKNAAKNGFGVSLELWSEEHRQSLARSRKLAGATEATLKQEVFRLATERLGKKPASAKEAAAAFGKPASALASTEALREILTEAGLL